ncbi:MAG: DNA repair exonuclease, partial [Oscillospiraceae bacterium]|nr:DNA repair exonuclease [Oscillospiraceae bacterium]
MSKLKILHAADLHLDSPFEALGAGKAAIRRQEQRQLLSALAELAGSEQVDLVLLSGDLLDSGNTYYETGEELIRSLETIQAPVFIAPGNHDFYSVKSPYARLQLPENVHIFRENALRFVSLPRLDARVYGAAFTENQSGPLLRGFHAERKEGVWNLLCLHGEVGNKDSVYDPISPEDLAQSGMDYAALGHIHKASGLQKAGSTWYSWPGCPEGRGFDETGEKTVSIVTLGPAGCELRPVSIAARRYETLRVDVTGKDPLLAIHTSLPDDTVRDVYRITLAGETESTPDLRFLHAN